MAEQKKLVRTGDRMVAGVASGVARYLEVDPVFVRLAFFVLALFQGIGAIIYLVMWLVVPDETQRELVGEDVIRANVEDMKATAKRLTSSVRTGSHGPAIFGIILVAVGALFLLNEFVPALPEGLFVPVILIGIGAYLLLARR